MDPRVFRFKTFVDELVTVEKRQIVALTETAKDIVALDGRIAPQIANVVTDRALKASADVQLPILYLLDSICKNVGEPFAIEKVGRDLGVCVPVHVMSAVEASMAHAGTIKPGGKKPMTRDPRLAGSDGVGQPAPVGDILSMLANTEDISSLLGVQVPVSALKSGEATTALDLKSDTIKVRNQAAISRLLNATRANQAAFLDNKFLKKKIYDGRKEHSRMWYLDIDTWYKGTTKNEEDSSGRQGEVQVAPKDEAPRLTSVPVDENQTECAVSGEKFEKYWDEKEQEWRYLDVVKVTGAMSARLGVPEGSLVCASTVDFGTIPSGMDTGQRRPAPIDNGGGDAKRIKIEKV
eukprot:jgi/Picre1/29214/NNA_004606.t1